MVSDQFGLQKKRDEADLNEYPADVKEEHLFLTSWLCELAQEYKDKIRIEIINASSLRGVFKSIRHWTQTYPTFIVNKKEKYCGSDKSRLALILQGHLGR
ncbi:MAG: hypothetical protein JSV83_08525 [Desulfobacterales bacterium]|nr:MAG: hypothetical protein JSV83_08525 [Desulfobacterales bacterium]